MKGWKKIYQSNGPLKQAGVAIHILDNVDFKLMLVRQHKGGYFKLINGKIHQKEITIISVHPISSNIH
jgi:hypothetical protein